MPDQKVLKVRSRALAAYIAGEIGVEAVPKVGFFEFVADADGRSSTRVSGKSLWQWEREFQASPFATYNQRIRSYGDEQRDLIQNISGDNSHA